MKPLHFLLLLLSFSCFAQIGGEDEVYLGGDRIDAKFNGGGMEKFHEFINAEFDYSKVTKPGKMVGAFTIDTEGNVKNIRIVEFFDMESATEFIRVLKKCPKWEPAKRGGKAISIEIKYPLVFKDKEQQPAQEAREDKTTVAESMNREKSNGGLSGFYQFIRKNYQQPNVPGLKGKVVVSFTINEDGTLGDYKIVKDLGYGTAQELIRVLKMTSGKWTPAEQNGVPVKSTFSLPLFLHVEDE